MNNIGTKVLKAKLRGFHLAGQSITRRISRSEKERKNRLWDSKRELGSYCRHHLIAYGLLRGTPYEQIERCAPTNKPNTSYLLTLLREHGGHEWTLERLMRLLEGAPMAQEKAA